MTRLLISTSSFGKANPDLIHVLEQSGFRLTLNPFGRTLTEFEAKDLYSHHDIIIAGTEPITRNVLEPSRDLRFICRLGAGIDNLDQNALKDFGIGWTNIPDAHVPAVAELTLAGILNLFRGVSCSDRAMRNKQWEKPMGMLLNRKTIGIVGLGRVGKYLSRLLKPFEGTIVSFDTHFDFEFANNNNILYAELSDLLIQSDVVTLHTSSAALRPIIDANELKLMKPDACLINTSRGANINESALIEHLKLNPSFSCFLDVFEKEPYVGSLAELPNCLLTAHIGSYAREVRSNMESNAVEIVIQAAKELLSHG